MKKPSVSEALYAHIFPRPRASDPTTFHAFVQRYLVGEVRLEVQAYYGSLDSIEPQYPGLDYTFFPHRRRLSRFAAHRRLFRAFDELGLTHGEILTLCVWEGTKCAKDKYERDHQRIIRDTTADGIELVQRRGEPFAEVPRPQRRKRAQQDDDSMDDYDSSGEQESEAEQTDEDEYDYSVGVQLNQQLQAAADARARGEHVVFDEQWEQWMKEAMERDDLSLESMLQAVRERGSLPMERHAAVVTNLTPATASEPIDTTQLSAVQALDNLQDLQASFRLTQSNIERAQSNLAMLEERLQAQHGILERVMSDSQSTSGTIETVVSGQPPTGTAR